MAKKKQQTGRIIIPPGMKPRPEDHEIYVAGILAKYFKADVEFVPRSNQRTPDFLIKGKVWELKSPTGTGKNNIQRQLQEAHGQSVNVILDASRSKMHPDEMSRRAEYQFKIVKSVKRLIFIPKGGEPLEIYR